MAALSQLCNGLPLAIAVEGVGNWIVYIIGLIGLVLIVLFLLLCLTMIPDLLRYLKIKSM